MIADAPMKLTPTHIQSARRHLRAADPVMKAIIDAVGPYTLRFERDRFAMLVRSIISPQISTTAARAIRNRLQELVGPEGLTCIAGGLAEANWGVPKEIEQQTLSYLDGQLRGVVSEFNRRFRIRDHRGTN